MPKKNKKKKTYKIPTKKIFKQYQDFIEKTVDEIRHQYGLTDFKMSYRWSEEDIEHPHNKVRLADVDIDEKYLTVSMCTYPELFERFKRKDYASVRSTMCHELAHVKTTPLERAGTARFSNQVEIDKYTENVTEILGRMMYQILYTDDGPSIKIKRHKNKKK